MQAQKKLQKDALVFIRILWLMAFILSVVVLLLYFISAKYFLDIIVQQLIVFGGTLFVLFCFASTLEFIIKRRKK